MKKTKESIGTNRLSKNVSNINLNQKVAKSPAEVKSPISFNHKFIEAKSILIENL